MKYLLLLLCFICLNLNAQNQGLEIAKKADFLDEGFHSTIADISMILRNKRKQESKRSVKNKVYEMPDDGDKIFIGFNSPKDIKGTATIIYSHKQGADDQWLYLPAVNRVKRINSENKSGPFMGSEFAYEDLSSQEVEKYTYKFIREEKKDGDVLSVVQRIPKYKKSGYTRQLVSYNKSKDYRIEKIAFYDRKDALLKTLIYKDYKKFLNKHWRALNLAMTNHQNGKETVLFFSNFKFKTALKESDFSPNGLSSARF